jgi:hypothetical protein
MDRDPNKKCISKKCKDCQLYQSWDMTDPKTGLRKNVNKCGLQVLFEEIPHIRGSIDGVQKAANQARNHSIQAQQIVGAQTIKFVQSLQFLSKKLLGRQ